MVKDENENDEFDYLEDYSPINEDVMHQTEIKKRKYSLYIYNKDKDIIISTNNKKDLYELLEKENE